MALKPASANSLSTPLLRRGDRLGFWASALCALHCALLPVAVAAVPAAGWGAIGNGDLDQAFVLFASLLGMTTAVLGFRRHREWRAAMLLLPGLALLWAGAFNPHHVHDWLHAGVMVGGGLLLALSHWWNLRLSHRAVAI